MFHSNIIKKFVFLVVTILTLLLVAYFSYNSFNKKEEGIPNNIEYTDTRELPDKYTAQVARDKGDIVVDKNAVYNKKKLDGFIDNIENKVPDKIQIVSYTKEGYPLIEQLYYNGTNITLITDNTRHKSILSEYREVNTYSVKKIAKQIKEKGTLYLAILDNGETFDIIFIKNQIYINIF